MRYKVTLLKFSESLPGPRIVSVLDAEETPERIRGFVADGVFYMDYDKVNHIFNVVPAPLWFNGQEEKEIDWSNPQISHKNVFLEQ